MSGHWSRTLSWAMALLAAIGIACSESKEEVKLAAVSVSPASATLAKGTSQGLVATAIYTNNTKKDVTAEAAWSVSDGTVLSVLSPGVARGMGVGAATVTATFEGRAGSAALTVTAAEVVSISVTPFQAEVPKGVPVRLTAMARMTDDTVQDVTLDATWSTSAENVAVCAPCGKVETRTEGEALITASFAGHTASTRLTVTAATMAYLEIQPAAPSVPMGMTEQMTAIGHFTDDTTQDLTEHVRWCTLDEEVAAISNTDGSQGLVSALAVGTTEICAVYCNTWNATAEITVTPAVPVSASIEPPVKSVPKGLTVAFRVSAVFSDGTSLDLTELAVWESSNEDIATVGNSGDEAGVAFGADVGTVTITAHIPDSDPDSEVVAQASLTVTAAVVDRLAVEPAEGSVPKGRYQQFTAMATMSDGTHQDLTSRVTWTSANEAVAPISNDPDSKGLAFGLDVGGPVAITARDPDSEFEATASFAVTAAVPESMVLDPSTASIPKGLTEEFDAIVTFSDGSHENVAEHASWASSNGDVATVSLEGLATGKGLGDATITATWEGLSAQATLTVREAEVRSILVEPIEVALPKGLARQFTATATLTDDSTADVTVFATWTSSDEAVATVSNALGHRGLATALEVGEATITATCPSGVSGSATMTVTREELVSIRVTPPHPVLPKGLRQQFSATGVYTDESEQDLTATVTWSSSDEYVAVVHNGLGAEGDTETLGVGTAEITATYPGTLLHGHAVIEVTAATLVKLEIAPAQYSMPKGREVEYEAWGLFTDSSSHDLTGDVTWSSSDPGIASMSGSVAKGVGIGTVTIGARYPGSPITAQASLTITLAVLDWIEVEPEEASIPDGRTQRFTATGHYSDDSESDITTTVSWWVYYDTGAVAVSNTDKGLATGLDPGYDYVCASDLETYLWSCGFLAVTDAVLDSIEIEAVDPTSASIPKGHYASFVAWGTYSDSDRIDITGSVSWSSSPGGAPVSDPGEFYGEAEGEYVVKATDVATGIFAEAALSVTRAELVWIEIAQSATQIPKGLTAQFSATGHFTDDSTLPYTELVGWHSSDDAIASVSNAAGSKGLATGIQVGSVEVWAVDPETGIETSSLGLEVLPARLTGLRIEPLDQQLPSGTVQQFEAIGSYTDGIDRDVTSSVAWASDDWDVAFPLIYWVYDPGAFYASYPGVATISARYVDLYADVTAEATLYVTDAAIAYVELYPSEWSLAVGGCVRLDAWAEFTDGWWWDVRYALAWSSSAEGTATVSNLPDDPGVVCGVATGDATITGTAPNGVSGSALVHVYAPEPPM